MKLFRILIAWIEDIIWQLTHPDKKRIWLYPPLFDIEGYEKFFNKWKTQKWRIIQDEG